MFIRFLENTPGFIFEPRPRNCLPDGFPDDIEGIGYFLTGYSPPEERIPEAKVDMGLKTVIRKFSALEAHETSV